MKERIIKGELREGDKLPSQDRLAESLGVSRGTLREGLHQLMLMGIIEMKQGSGTYIRSVTPSSFMESLSPALKMNKSSAIELLDARLYIEGAVASLAAKKASREDIRGLRELLEDMRLNLEGGNTEGFIRDDLQFHMLIAQSSKNRVLMKVVETIRDVLYEFIAEFFSAKPETVKNALEFHTKIFAAIESRDAQEARKQMESHIRSLIRMIHKWDLTVQLKSESGIEQRAQ